MPEAWYCMAFGQELGPMSFADLKTLVDRGDVLPSDLVRCGTVAPWQAAETRAEFYPAAQSPGPAPPPDAEAGAESPGKAIEPAEASPDETTSSPPASAPARGEMRYFAAASMLLALVGGSAGALAALVWGGDARPAVASVSSAVDEAKIAALRQQIEELDRQRRDLLDPAKPAPPAQAPGDSPAKSGAASIPPAPVEPSAQPPADKPEPAADRAADSPPEPKPDADEPMHDLPAAERAPPPAAARPAAPPPQASVQPPPPSAAGNPETSELSLEQTLERQRQRLELLRQIYAERAALLAQHAELEAEQLRLAKAVGAAEGRLTVIGLEYATLQAKIAAETVNPNRNSGLINLWNREIADLTTEAGLIRAQLVELNARQASVAEQIKQLVAEADQLRSRWLAVVDPFGQLDRGEEETAIAAFTEWITLEPKAPWVWLARGFAYWQLGKLEAALDDFNAAVRLEGPALSNSLAARGGLLHALGRPKEAMADFGKALKSNKADGMVYLFRARAYCADEKYAQADKDFKTATRLGPDDAEAFRQYALLQAACPKDRFRNAKKALENAQRACELTEWKSWSALDVLAAAHAEAGEFEEACRWAEKAAELTYGANRGQCLAHLKLYQSGQPLRFDWKNQSGNPSAAADAPLTQ